MVIHNMQKGWIELICGPMFAGKTEEVIRRVRRLQYAHKKVAVFKPTIDDRYSDEEIVSHNRSRIQSVNITNIEEVAEFVRNNRDVDAIVVDEVQFIEGDVTMVLEAIADSGIRVIVAALDRDFRGESFKVMETLLPKADLVTKLTSICTVCGQAATRSQRLIDGEPASYDEDIVLIGATESYEPRCRHCHEIVNPNKYEL